MKSFDAQVIEQFASAKLTCPFFLLFHEVVSEMWENHCIRLRVNVKSDNCGENSECSGKGICYSNNSMVCIKFTWS